MCGYGGVARCGWNNLETSRMNWGWTFGEVEGQILDKKFTDRQ